MAGANRHLADAYRPAFNTKFMQPAMLLRLARE